MNVITRWSSHASILYPNRVNSIERFQISCKNEIEILKARKTNVIVNKKYITRDIFAQRKEYFSKQQRILPFSYPCQYYKDWEIIIQEYEKVDLYISTLTKAKKMMKT